MKPSWVFSFIVGPKFASCRTKPFPLFLYKLQRTSTSSPQVQIAALIENSCNISMPNYISVIHFSLYQGISSFLCQFFILKWQFFILHSQVYAADFCFFSHFAKYKALAVSIWYQGYNNIVRYLRQE